MFVSSDYNSFFRLHCFVDPVSRFSIYSESKVYSTNADVYFQKIKLYYEVLALAQTNETGLRQEIAYYHESFPTKFILRRPIFDVPGLGDIAKFELYEFWTRFFMC